jgi:crossover junction endodeoxyribonuclease RuvC
MFVLGIDPGLARTGYGIVEEISGTVRAVAAGVLRTDPSRPVAERLVELHRDLVALVAEYRPHSAGIEEVFVNRNLQTATAVGRASGVAMVAVAGAGVEITGYTPTAVKMALAGYGGAPKEQVQRVVAMRLGLRAAPEPADAADALAVALCHLQNARMQRAVREANVKEAT